MTALALTEGSVFVGRYRILRLVAAGGMGSVYEVLHLATERRSALKVMLPHLVSSDELRERFRLEARIAAKIKSAYIVDVLDAGVDDETGMPFLVMELLCGEEIGKRLTRMGKFSSDEAVSYLWQVALALDKTHAANIVHRDLKPENLFLAEQSDGPPRIKVLDFGIAKFVAEHTTQANATGSIGTPLYMAPEQFRSGGKVSPATDLFSLGMMAYTLLVGTPYWREEQCAEENVYAFVASVTNGPRERASSRAKRRGVCLPSAFDDWFVRATALDPKARFGSAKDAICALAEGLRVTLPKELNSSDGPKRAWQREIDGFGEPNESIPIPLSANTAASGLSSSHPKVEAMTDAHRVAMGSRLDFLRKRSPSRLFFSVVFALGLGGFSLLVRNTLHGGRAVEGTSAATTIDVAETTGVKMPPNTTVLSPSAVVSPSPSVLPPTVAVVDSARRIPAQPAVRAVRTSTPARATANTPEQQWGQ